MSTRSTAHWVAGFAFLFAIILTPILLNSVSGILNFSVLQMVTVAMMLANLIGFGVFSLVVQMSSDRHEEWEKSSHRPYIDAGSRNLHDRMNRPPSQKQTGALIAGIDPERKEFVFE